MKIDEVIYGNDADMEHILHRMTMAASDANILHKMNGEDVYISAIEKRDTEILALDKCIAEQKAQLAEQESMLRAAIKMQLDAGKAQLTEQESMLRATIKMLLDAGKTPGEISSNLGKDLETILRLAKS